MRRRQVVRIGVLSDISGTDISCPNSVVAAKMALQDSGLAAKAGKSKSSVLH
jgi:hypothetical protein